MSADRNSAARMWSASRPERRAARQPSVPVVRADSQPTIGSLTALHDIERLSLGGRWLDGACRQLAALLREREQQLIEAVLRHVCAAVPDGAADHDRIARTALRQIVLASAQCGLATIEQGSPWSRPLPEVFFEQTRRATAVGAQLHIVLSRCAVGYAFAWRTVLHEAGELELSEERRCVLVLHVSALLGWLLALVQAEIAIAHAAELRRMASSREDRRLDLVQHMLDGGSLSVAERIELQYPLEAWHIAIIAADPTCGDALGELASRLRCRLLQVPHGESVWAWLGASRRIAFRELEEAVRLSSGLAPRLIVGEPAWGREGWAQSSREAQAATLVARHRDAALTRYLDVAPEATVLQDKALADSLIERYLTPLERLRIGGPAARRVLAALFDAEHSISSAAHALGLHRSTVHRHRNEIEHALDCRLAEHQVEIGIALRIAAIREGAASHLAAPLAQTFDG
jgi:hypothetical protein